MLKDGMKVIQSYMPHAMTFFEGEGIQVTVPVQTDPRNIVEVTEEQLKELAKMSIFQGMLKSKQVRILDNIPHRYEDAAEQYIKEKVRADEAVEKISEKDKQLTSKDAEIKRLQAQIAALGGKR